MNTRAKFGKKYVVFLAKEKQIYGCIGTSFVRNLSFYIVHNTTYFLPKNLQYIQKIFMCVQIEP
jgi:hypothetical protein